MNLSYKYRLQPTPGQVEILEQLNHCRLTYNALLSHCYDERKAGRGTPTHNSLTYLLPELKAKTPELGKVFSQVLQNVAKRVRYGFENYWARRRAGLKATTPHFRRVRDYSSLTYPVWIQARWLNSEALQDRGSEVEAASTGRGKS